MQPYIHNCIVNVHEGAITHQFMVFFKHHCHLRTNNIMSVKQNFRGDAVVMRVAARNSSSVVNMRDRDTIIADWVISRSVHSRYLYYEWD